MTKRSIAALQSVFAAMLLMFITGCEDPELKVDKASDPVVEPTVKSDPIVDPVAKSEAPPIEDEAPKEPEYPYFHIYGEGKTIVIAGALRSNIQIERIGSRMIESFPDVEVKNELKIEYHRHAVSWGKRVVQAVLLDYFVHVKDPSIEYKDGVVTLSGTVKNKRDHQQITEMAIQAFSDSWTSDLVNKIKVAEGQN